MHENERYDEPDGAAADGEPVVLDLEKALERLDYDRSLFNEMAAFFLADCESLLAGIRSGRSEHAGDEQIRAAHTLKNLAATCGGDRAAKAAEQVERLGIAGAWGAVPTALSRLEAEVAALSERLRGLAWES